MKTIPGLSSAEKNKVLEIIKKYLPDANVTVFGSRLRGDHKEYSDLDLCFEYGGKPLPLETISALKEAFSASDLVFKIDIVDWNRITPDFQKVIKSEGQLFHL